MNKLKKELQQRKQFLEKAIKLAQQELADAPQEKLRISKSSNSVQYYLCSDEICKTIKNGKYVKRKDQDIVNKIAQRDYCKVLLERADKELKQVNKLLVCLDENNLEDVYENLNEYRKPLIKPIIAPRDLYIKNWLEQEYISNPFADGTVEIYSEKGERVRSKSEKIIADLLYKHKVPYIYEKPLKLSVYNRTPITVYPDFTILDADNRQEVYLEHLGMMDNLEYVSNAMIKISTYEKAGYLLGDELLLTYETGSRPLDTKLVEKVVEAYFTE